MSGPLIPDSFAVLVDPLLYIYPLPEHGCFPFDLAEGQPYWAEDGTVRVAPPSPIRRLLQVPAVLSGRRPYWLKRHTPSMGEGSAP